MNGSAGGHLRRRSQGHGDGPSRASRRPRTRSPRRGGRGRHVERPGPGRRTRLRLDPRQLLRAGCRHASVSAVASATGRRRDAATDFRVALGAVNPFTRHPVVLAMTGSALDEMLPGRIVMGLGTGLPLRLKQMGIPYDPGDGRRRASRRRWTRSARCGPASGCRRRPPGCRRSSRCSRRPTASRSSSPPTASEFVALAGQKADGYLARPAESIPSLRGILARLRAAADGRRPRPRTRSRSAGYLLSLVDETRREALNRAKREPFVIYMMSVLSRRLAAPGRLRRATCATAIAAAWRAEDYTTAGNLIPDELLDAFMLCGTREDVAAKAMAFHAEAGLGLPLLQPVLQEDRQIDELVAAARASTPRSRSRAAGRGGRRPSVGAPSVGAGGRAGRARRAGVAAAAAAARVGRRPERLDRRCGAGALADDRRLGLGPRIRRRAGARLGDPPAVRLHRVGHPGRWPAAALAAVDGRFEWGRSSRRSRRACCSTPARTSSTRSTTCGKGIDTITSPRASHAIVKGRMTRARRVRRWPSPRSSWRRRRAST